MAVSMSRKQIRSSLESMVSQNIVLNHVNTSVIADIKEKYSSFKSWLRDSKEWFLNDLAYTKREILYGAAAGLVFFTALRLNHEIARDHSIRLAFSETSAGERQAQAEGRAMPRLGNLSTKTNDFYMKHFEVWNESWENGGLIIGNDKPFAKELEYKIDITFKTHHYELPQLAAIIVPLADSVLNDLHHLRQMQYNIGLAVNLFDKAWKDSHNDVTHEDCWEETETDEDGNTTTEEHCITVYDYTDNDYEYFKWAGEQASGKMADIRAWFPKISTEGHFVPTKEIGADNQYAMHRSRKEELKNKNLSMEQMLVLANSAIYGSRLYTDLKALRELQDFLDANGIDWANQKNNAHSYSKRTYDYSHAASPEFITCETAQDNGKAFIELVDMLMETVEDIKQRVPRIMKMDSLYIDQRLNGKKAGPDMDASKIIAESKKGYKKLYPAGINIDTAEYGYVLLWGIMGAVLGGLLGAGVDALADKYNLYGRKRKEQRNYE